MAKGRLVRRFLLRRGQRCLRSREQIRLSRRIDTTRLRLLHHHIELLGVLSREYFRASSSDGLLFFTGLFFLPLGLLISSLSGLGLRVGLLDHSWILGRCSAAVCIKYGIISLKTLIHAATFRS